MPGDLAYKPSLFIEVHSLEIRLVVGKDLVGLGNDPNLQDGGKQESSIVGLVTCLGAIIINGRPWKVLYGFPFEQHLMARKSGPDTLYPYGIGVRS